MTPAPNCTRVLPMNAVKQALCYGDTTPTAIFMGVATVLHAGSLLTQSGLGSYALYTSLRALLPIEVWAAVYLVAGTLVVWKVLVSGNSPPTAWTVNLILAGTWCMTVAMTVGYGGWTTLFSTYTALGVAALWLLVRTEATPSDREVA